MLSKYGEQLSSCQLDARDMAGAGHFPHGHAA